MSKRFSKTLLVIEALLLVVPIGVLFTTLLPGAFILLLGPATSRAASLLVFAMGGALIAAARVIAAFWTDPVSGLRRVHVAWWWLCAAGAVISVAGVVAVILKRSIGLPANDFTFALKLAVFGIPLLVPLAHVVLEYFLRRGSAHAG